MFRQSRIYFSYATAETDLALTLAADLKNEGLPIWIDRLDADLVSDWPTAVNDGLRMARAMIVVLSPDSVRSDYTLAEIAYAAKNELIIIPIIVNLIKQEQIPVNVPRHALIDFTDWREEQIYRRRLEVLINSITAFGEFAVPHALDSQTRYLNQLISQIEAEKGILEFLDLSSSDGKVQNHGQMRPVSRQSQIWGMHSRLHYLEPHEESSERWHRSLVGTMAQALSRSPRLVLLGAKGAGKTTVMQRMALDAAFAYRAEHSQGTPIEKSTLPLPLYLNISDWFDDVSIETFIKRAWRFDGDAIQLLSEGKILLFLDGLTELGAQSAEKADELREWLYSDFAPAHVVISARTREYTQDLDLGLPAVEIQEMEDNEIRHFVNNILHGQEAVNFLNLLFPRTKEERDQAYSLTVLARIPAHLHAMMFCYKSSPQLALPATIGGLYKRYFAALWIQKRLSQMPAWVEFKEMEAALSTLAIAILDDDRPSTVNRSNATLYLQEERYLQACRNAGLLKVTKDTVRFVNTLTRDYFAAAGLSRTDIISRLQNAQLDAWGERIASKWDHVIVMMAGILPNADSFVRDVSEVDPSFGALSMASGVKVSEAVVDTIIRSMVAQKAQNASQSLNSDANSKATVGVLLEMMRTGSWNARNLALQLLVEQDPPIPPDLFQAYSEWDYGMNSVVAEKIRLAGAMAIPLLIRVLSDEKSDARRGAAWALGELRDTAAVPALVAMLNNENDVTVLRDVINSLSLMNDMAALNPILNILSYPDTRLKKIASSALVNYRGNALPGLIELLESENEDTRIISAKTLGAIGLEDAFDALMNVTEDESPVVRATTAEALGLLRSPRAIPRLVEMLLDNHPIPHEGSVVADSAAEALSRIGTDEALNHYELWRRRQDNSSGVVVPTYSDWNALTTALQSPLADVRAKATLQLPFFSSHDYLSKLAYLLKDEHVSVRHAVVHALEGNTSDQSIVLLLSALHDEEPAVSDDASKVLARLGAPAIDGLVHALNDPSVNVRGAALEALGRINNNNTVHAIASKLHDTDSPKWENVRICDMAAKILEAMGTRESLYLLQEWQRENNIEVTVAPVPPIQTGYDDEDIPEGEIINDDDGTPSEDFVEEQPTLRDTISSVKDDIQDAVDKFLETLLPFEDALTVPQNSADNSDWVPWGDPQDSNIVSAPSVSPEPDADNAAWPELPALLNALKDGDYAEYRLAAKALNEGASERRYRADETTIRLLTDAFRHPDMSIRWAAINALTWLNNPATISAFLIALKDEQSDIRLAGVRGINELGDRNAAGKLLDLIIHDPIPIVRESAAHAMGNLKHPAAVQTLLKALEDSEGFVRRAAVVALGEIKDKATLPAIAEMVNDPEAQIRWTTVQALANFNDPSTVPYLVKLLNDTSRPPYREDTQRICDEVEKVLEQLKTPEAKIALEKWRLSSNNTRFL